VSKEIVCPPETKFCVASCEHYKVCQKKDNEEMQVLFNEIMDEAEASRPKENWSFCPCETCIYEGKESCDLENEEPFKSRKKEGCPDWDEGEIECDY
jgi:hypothetical protein